MENLGNGTVKLDELEQRLLGFDEAIVAIEAIDIHKARQDVTAQNAELTSLESADDELQHDEKIAIRDKQIRRTEDNITLKRIIDTMPLEHLTADLSPSDASEL